jgi:hypothetical protein
MSIEIVKPSIVNNIEFYVSADGTQSGVSQRGLARLCGVAENSIRNIVNVPRKEKPSKALESFVGNVFHCDMTSDQGAKIITTDAATDIIFYYAFESSATNDMAKFSAREFAKQGMHNWIKKITGFSVSDNNHMLTATINELYHNIQILTAEMKEWRTVRKVADASMEGVNILIEEINNNEEFNQPESDGRTYTIAEWLEEEKGVTNLSTGDAIKIGRSVAQTYKSLRQYKPKQVRRMYKSPRMNYMMPKVTAGYVREDFPILEVAYNEFLLR